MKELDQISHLCRGFIEEPPPPRFYDLHEGELRELRSSIIDQMDGSCCNAYDITAAEQLVFDKLIDVLDEMAISAMHGEIPENAKPLALCKLDEVHGALLSILD